jgi:hypothetical protein
MESLVHHNQRLSINSSTSITLKLSPHTLYNWSSSKPRTWTKRYRHVFLHPCHLLNQVSLLHSYPLPPWLLRSNVHVQCCRHFSSFIKPSRPSFSHPERTQNLSRRSGQGHTRDQGAQALLSWVLRPGLYLRYLGCCSSSCAISTFKIEPAGAIKVWPGLLLWCFLLILTHIERFLVFGQSRGFIEVGVGLCVPNLLCLSPVFVLAL